MEKNIETIKTERAFIFVYLARFLVIFNIIGFFIFDYKIIIAGSILILGYYLFKLLLTQMKINKFKKDVLLK